MTTPPSVQPMPREQAPAQYLEANERRYRGQVDDELQYKHDKRSNLVLGRGKSLVLSSPSGITYSLGLSDTGILTVTDAATGDVATIILDFDQIDGELDANRINFGAQTSFDLATETFITEVGGVRSRYGTAFGSGASVVMWHGPTSVAQGSESRTNGYLAIGTDGLIYHNASALSWGATASEGAASNALAAIGVNALYDTDFTRGTDLWAATYQGDTGLTRTTGVNLAAFSPTLFYGQRNVLWGTVTGTPTAGTVFDIASAADAGFARGLKCSSGARLYARCYASFYRATSARIVVAYYNSAGSFISQDTIDGGLVNGGQNGDPANYSLIEGYVTAPATTAYADFRMRIVCNGTEANPYGFFMEPMLMRVPAGQTTTGIPYMAGRPDPLADPTIDNTAAAITGQGLLALGNFYEQTTDPGSVANGSLWSNTGSKVLYIRTGGLWKKIANIGADLAVVLDNNNTIGASPLGPVTATASGGSGGYTYAWTKVSGDTFTLSAPTAAATTFTGSSGFLATYRCTVTDSLGSTVFQDVSITVL